MKKNCCHPITLAAIVAGFYTLIIGAQRAAARSIVSPLRGISIFPRANYHIVVDAALSNTVDGLAPLYDDDDGRSHSRSYGAASVYPAFLRQIQEKVGGLDIDIDDIIKAAALDEDEDKVRRVQVKVQTLRLTKTSPWHTDSEFSNYEKDDGPRERKAFTKQHDKLQVGFFLSNTNEDAYFETDDGELCIPIVEGNFVSFDGSVPHRSVVKSGHIDMIGPFLLSSQVLSSVARKNPKSELISVQFTTTKPDGKANKPPHCPPVTTNMTCGKTFENTVITLGQDLFCNEILTQPPDDTRNAAITLVGKNAVLDCQGYSISQWTNSTASAIDCDVFPSNASERLRMKQECGLFYQFGIIAKEGATVKNCNVKKFFYGCGTEVGVIENSVFSLNTLGVQVLNTVPNTLSKVVNSNIYNNALGLAIFQLNEEGGAKVLVKDVVSKNNGDPGVQISGTGITLLNVKASNNDGAGIEIVGYPTVPSVPYPRTDVTFEGIVSLNNNEAYGILVVNSDVTANGTIHVTGDLNTDRNGMAGVVMVNNTAVSILLGEASSFGKSSKGSSGSLTSCGNGEDDIVNNGKGVFEGSDYTCGESFTENNAQLPQCKPCPDCSLS